MRRVATALVAAAAVLAGCGYGGESGGARTLNWYVFKEPGGAFDQAAKTCTEQARGRYRVEVVPLPTNADQQRELLVRRLAAEDSDIDIIGMDVIWTAEFAEAGWIREWTGADAQAARQGVIPALLRSAQYQERLWAAPFTTNTQLLWFNKDIVKRPPETWDELLDQARRLGAKGTTYIQAARYEGLVVWFNTLIESLGGQIVDEDGNVKLDRRAVRAADVMQRLGSSSAAPPGLSNIKEDEARLGFQDGSAAFQLNYTFIYASAGEEAPEFQKKIGWARYPAMEKGQPSRPPVGGINLGVGAYGKNPELAFEAAKCLAQPENQLVAAEKGGLPPTQERLYEDARIKKAFPFADVLRDSLATAEPRPVTPAYSDISLAVQAALHPVSAIEPRETIEDMRDKLETVAEGGIF